eukprot:gene18335-24026_t
MNTSKKINFKKAAERSIGKFARFSKSSNISSTPTGVHFSPTNEEKESWPGPFATAYEIVNQREEAKRLREELISRQQNGEIVDISVQVDETLEAASSEECDWKSQPLALLRGEICGSYYKILGLDRKRGIIDKSDIKKAYRSKSLSVHPDKNPSSEAIEAFKLVQDAYECLSDDNCRRTYDRQLSETEERIATFREELKKQFIDKALNA